MLALLILIPLTLLVWASAVTAAPTAPSELRATVYSKSTLELFWSRSSASDGIEGYMLIRNGERIWLGDVTSFLDNQLVAGAENNYQVVARAFGGAESAVSGGIGVAVLDPYTVGCDSEYFCTSITAFSVSDSIGGSSIVAAALAARVEIYSSSAVELFWDRAPADWSVVAYEIYRDGEFFQRTDGISFFDSGVQPGIDHAYEIVPISTDASLALDSISLALFGGSSTTAASHSSSDSHGSSSHSTSSSTDGSSSSSSTSHSHSDSGSSSLAGSVYSSSAVELFWTYDYDHDVYFEIVRDGAVLTQRDGSSYYDDGLGSYTTYEYEVIAIERVSGARHSLGSVGLTTKR